MFRTSQVLQMMRRVSLATGVAGSLSLALAIPPTWAADTLVGRAVLRAATFAEGPTSGQQLGADSVNRQGDMPFRCWIFSRSTAKVVFTGWPFPLSSI